MYKNKYSIYLLILMFISPVIAESKIKIPEGEGPWVVLSHYQDKQQVLDIKPYFDLWKIDEKNKTVLMMVNHQSDFKELADLGFRVVLHDQLMKQQIMLTKNKENGIKTITNFPCYRTVAETYAAMSDMNTNYPDLVTLVDIGDSWHKTEPGGDAGYDMQVVKITNELNGVTNKPVLYAMGSIHSREYPPAELVTRFAENLLSGYGNNADITWLIDYHEIHLLLQGNPDGRNISENESSANQRKNRNENHCLGGNQQGVDMNRNFEFLWNQGTGSSGSDCSQVFRGDFAVSEPETAAINSYIQTLFPDERPDDIVTPAPLTKPGVYLDIHNVAELTLFPFGYSNSAGPAPNHDQLQTLARRMSFYTGYRPEQSNASLGGADGASDDNAYGTLGVAAYTIELGEGGFYSSCSSFENTIWPDNFPALIYAAKASRMPYVMASGPDVIGLPPSAIQVAAGQTFDISGTATDLQFNNSGGTESTHNITAVKAYLGTPSWVAGATAIDLNSDDGNFNSSVEDFSGSIDSTGLPEGRYTLWIEATDDGFNDVVGSPGVTGVAYAVFVDVVDPNSIGTVSGVVRDADTNELIEFAEVSFDGNNDLTDLNGEYSIQTSATISDLTVSKLGYLSQTVNAVETTAGQTTIQNVLLEPSCDQIVLVDDVETYSNISDAQTAGWSLLTGSGSNDWRIESTDDHTTGSGNSFVSTDVNSTSDKSLVSPAVLLPENAELIFWHKHQFEAGNDYYDGGVIEISNDGGANWQDLGPNITQNGYGGTLNGGFGQPLGAVEAFVDSLGVFTEVKVDLSSFANSTILIRWRMGTDNTQNGGDWKIDDIEIKAVGVCGNNDIIFIDDFEG